MKICGGEWRCSSTNLILGTIWKVWSASRPARIALGERPRYQLNRRFGGGGAEPLLRLWKSEKPLAPAEIQTPDRLARSLVTVPRSVLPTIMTNDSHILSGCGVEVVSALYSQSTAT
jgi:hypothetical protein